MQTRMAELQQPQTGAVQKRKDKQKRTLAEWCGTNWQTCEQAERGRNH